MQVTMTNYNHNNEYILNQLNGRTVFYDGEELLVKKARINISNVFSYAHLMVNGRLYDFNREIISLTLEDGRVVDVFDVSFPMSDEDDTSMNFKEFYAFLSIDYTGSIQQKRSTIGTTELVAPKIDPFHHPYKAPTIVCRSGKMGLN